MIQDEEMTMSLILARARIGIWRISLEGLERMYDDGKIHRSDIERLASKEDRLFTVSDLKHWGFKDTLYKWIRTGTFKRPLRIGGMWFLYQSDCEATFGIDSITVDNLHHGYDKILDVVDVARIVGFTHDRVLMWVYGDVFKNLLRVNKKYYILQSDLEEILKGEDFSAIR